MNRYLLDTHVVLWALAGHRRLPRPVRDRITDPAADALVSVASIWEIGLKRALGKLDAPDDLVEIAEASGFVLLDITAAHAWDAAALRTTSRRPVRSTPGRPGSGRAAHPRQC